MPAAKIYKPFERRHSSESWRKKKVNGILYSRNKTHNYWRVYVWVCAHEENSHLGISHHCHIYFLLDRLVEGKWKFYICIQLLKVTRFEEFVQILDAAFAPIYALFSWLRHFVKIKFSYQRISFEFVFALDSNFMCWIFDELHYWKHTDVIEYQV